MKRGLKVLLLSSAFILASEALFSADATVTFVKGKVEVLKNNEWIALNPGDELKKSDVINTGFQSEAKIKLFDSVMYLGPVTRISLENLSKTDDQDKVNVYLKTGNVRSQVNHTESKRVSYQVRTAVAVASVRGTDWEIDDSNNVTCFQGAVATASVRALTSSASENMEESPELPDDGVVVQANQTISVSDSNFTSTPVSQVVQAANEVVSAVATAAASEAVSAATSVSVSDVAATATPAVVQEFGNLIVKPVVDIPVVSVPGNMGMQ